MPVAIETVIIVIVVVSFTVLAAIIFALYWLWRLLLEDRRCTRVESYSLPWRNRTRNLPGFAVVLTTSNEAPNEEEHRTPLTSGRRNSFPRITRGSDVIVDERGLRMTRHKQRTSPPERNRNELRIPTEVIVLDGTEPPPPYDATS